MYQYTYRIDKTDWYAALLGATGIEGVVPELQSDAVTVLLSACSLMKGCVFLLMVWTGESLCTSVHLSLLFHYANHRTIMKFSGVITNDKSKVHANGQGQRSKVKVTEFKTQLNRFQTATPVWIHIWWWNDAQSLMLLRKGALLFFKVTRDKKLPILTWIERFRTVT